LGGDCRPEVVVLLCVFLCCHSYVFSGFSFNCCSAAFFMYRQEVSGLFWGVSSHFVFVLDWPIFLSFQFFFCLGLVFFSWDLLFESPIFPHASLEITKLTPHQIECEHCSHPRMPVCK
jgi:hypothetical protein